jgi:hypothetical protein
MTLDRRYQIFISSTFQGLERQRRDAINAILEAGHIPVALELYSPQDKSNGVVIERTIRKCQVFLLILGHRYGSIVPGSEVSYTELEFQLATKHGLLVLAFLLDDNKVKTLRHRLDRNKESDKDEIRNEKKFDVFRGGLGRFTRRWATGSAFKAIVTKAMFESIRECEKPGFIPEPADRNLLDAIWALKNPFVVDVVNQLASFKKLSQRCLLAAEEKEAAAQLFARQYGRFIESESTNLFLESGSTIVFVARALSPYLQRRASRETHRRESLDAHRDGFLHEGGKIATNNILAFLHLWLRERVPCFTFPLGPPGEESYGASYGPIERLTEFPPDYELKPLNQPEDAAIAALSAAFQEFLSPMRRTLVLGAASGLQLTADIDVNFAPRATRKSRSTTTRLVKQCRGPHVGSYWNRIFKRFLYQSGHPIMLFITADKVNCSVDATRCHFVLGRDFNWARFQSTVPVGFCVGCKQDEADRLKSQFSDLGFEIVDGDSTAPHTAFIAKNAQFVKAFESIPPTDVDPGE